LDGEQSPAAAIMDAAGCRGVAGGAFISGRGSSSSPASVAVRRRPGPRRGSRFLATAR